MFEKDYKNDISTQIRLRCLEYVPSHVSLIHNRGDQKKVPSCSFTKGNTQGNLVIKSKLDEPIDSVSIFVTLTGKYIYNKSNKSDVKFSYPEIVFFYAEIAVLTNILIKKENTFPIDFGGLQIQYESYEGIYFRSCYSLELWMQRKGKNIYYKREDIIVRAPQPFQKTFNRPLQLRNLRINNVFDSIIALPSHTFPLNGMILSQIVFSVVDSTIRFVEVALCRAEMCTVDNIFGEQSFTKLNIHSIDEAPVVNQMYIVRFKLANYILYPSFNDRIKRIEVKYFLQYKIIFENEKPYLYEFPIRLVRSE